MRKKRSLLARISLLLILAMGLSACGTKFLYNRADTLAYFYLSSKVSLQDDQAHELRAALSEIHDWHRESELPDYARYLESLAQALAQPIGVQGFDDARRDLENLWQTTVAGLAPSATRWLAELHLEQREEVFASMAQQNTELREEYCEPEEEELRRNREKSVDSSLRDWIGRMSAEQRALVNERLASLEANGCDWVDSRERFRERLRTLINNRASEPDYTASMERLLTHPEDGWDADYRARYEANRDIVVAMLAQLDQTLSERQRAKLVHRLQSYAANFRELTATSSSRK